VFEGNVCTGIFNWAFLLHSGNNATFSNNIVDLTDTLGNTDNGTVFFVQESGPPNYGTTANVSIGGNIIYNGSTTAEPYPSIGLFDTDPDPSLLTPPTLTKSWYYTGFGSFGPPFCWAAGTVSGGLCDPAGVFANPQFVNPSAQTAAGFHMQAGSAPLTGGFKQIVQTQGPR
jgi:hypothetical protein